MSATVKTHKPMRKLAIGTAQFGMDYGIANRSGKVDSAAVAEILADAQAAGVSTLDTAVDYGDSEAALGQAGIDGWQVISKLPAVPADTADPGNWMQQQVKASLQRLGIGQLAGLLLHRPAQLLDSGGAAIYRGLEKIRSGGLAERIGVSVYTPDELDAVWQKFDEFDLVQAPLNIFDRRLLSSGWLERLHNQGVEVHTRSVFLQGLLLMQRQQRPAKFARWNTLWQQWDAWLTDNHASALQTCIAYPLSLPAVSKVIVGIDSLAQWQQILAAATAGPAGALPALQCDDPELLNPALWTSA